MKRIYIKLTFLFFVTAVGVIKSQSETYDLQFIELLNNGINFDVKVQIKASTQFQLASSNITFNFDAAGLNNPTLTQKFNFDGEVNPSSNYDLMTVTNPNGGVASINIYLTDSISSLAAPVAVTWTDVATIRFNVSNPALTSGLTFRNQLPSNTVVYSCTGNLGSFQTFLLTPGMWSPLNNPLPVELSNFSAKFKDNNNVELNWVTKTEVNNYGFYVERKVNDGQWNSLTFIEGHGNSNSPKEYSYSDKDLFAGGSKFRYRLKQVDTDGKFEYSDIVEVEILPTKFELSQNYPNPFNPSTTIQFSLPKATQLKINIYNMLGELVETLAEGTYEAGYHEVTFTASNCPSGIYIYRIESSAFTQVRKMVLIK
ncbi:MAG: hypothetical protein BroJett005_13450 [Ignavibacteriota bacterium]|nr:MAG: hypothetical protein BroJett005_13450 [Ignavibacteriota bacterium]